MHSIKLLPILIFLQFSSPLNAIPLHTVRKRGIPVSGPHSGAQLQSNAYARQAGNDAISQLRDQERVAEWSAANAVGNAVGKDYANTLATTAQFVAQFTAPVTKEQAQNVFNTVGNFQKASKISGALANSGGAIRHAANNAASSSYQQALQAENAGYHRGASNHYGGGGGGGGYGGGSGSGGSYGSSSAWS